MKINNNIVGDIHIDNGTSFPFPWKLLADLEISESKIIWERDKKSIHFKIKNKGVIDSSSFYVKLYAKSKYKSKVLLKQFYIPQLKQGKTIEEVFDLTSNHKDAKDIDMLIIEVDVNHQIKESNEKNNIQVVNIPIKELVYDNTRQVKIEKIDNSEKIKLFADGIPYQFSCKSGNYEGCGIDAAHSFMGWLNDTISRAKIKQYIKTTDLTDTIFGDMKDGDTFTTPAQMSDGLESLVNRTEYKVVRHHKNDDNFVLSKIEHYLKNGMPIVALINKGYHWVTIVGMESRYDDDKISLNSQITYIDLTAGNTYTTSYTNLKICHWSSPKTHQFVSSYEAGTIISIDEVPLRNSYEKNTYKIEIHTGNVKGAGTDAHVSLKLMSSNGDEYTYIMDTICDDNEKGSTTIKSFIVDDYLEDIESIELIRNNVGRYSDWYVSYIKITETTTDREFLIPINSWISSIEENVYSLENNAISYYIQVETGDAAYAGTDAEVYIKLYGTKGHSSFIRLDNQKNNFEKNSIDSFNIQHKDIGDIIKIKVKHNNSGDKAGWFLEKILISKQSENYNFTAKQWISANKGFIPEITLIEDFKRIQYEVEVRTSTAKKAGTDAGVYIQLFGTNNKKTPLQRIDHLDYDDFEKSSIGRYVVYADEDLGEINKLKLEHDNTGDGAGWKIHKITINNRYIFTIDTWLESDNKKVHPSKIFRR